MQKDSDIDVVKWHMATTEILYVPSEGVAVIFQWVNKVCNKIMITLKR